MVENLGQRLIIIVAVLAFPSAVQAQLKTYKAVCLAIDHGRRLQVGTPYFETTLSELELRKLFIGYAKQENITGDLNCYRETDQEPFRYPVESTGITEYHYSRGYTSRRISWRPNEKSEIKTKMTWVNYLSVGKSLANNGYSTARVPLRYVFLNCGGEIHVAYSLDVKRIEVGPYVYNRKSFPTAGQPLPQISSIELAAQVRRKMYPEIIHYLKDVNTGPALGFGCFTGQTQKIGSVAALVGRDAKPEVVRAYLEELVVSDARVDPWRFLRNTAFETGTRVEPAAQRPAAPAAPEDGTAVRDLNAGLARDAHTRNAVFNKAQVDYRNALARHQAEVAAIAARNAARAADYARQKAAADAAQAAYEAQLKAMRR